MDWEKRAEGESAPCPDLVKAACLPPTKPGVLLAVSLSTSPTSSLLWELFSPHATPGTERTVTEAQAS